MHYKQLVIFVAYFSILFLITISKNW